MYLLTIRFSLVAPGSKSIYGDSADVIFNSIGFISEQSHKEGHDIERLKGRFTANCHTKLRDFLHSVEDYFKDPDAFKSANEVAEEPAEEPEK